MTEKEKKELSETDICDLFITPAIKDAGWDPFTQIRREVTLTPGPVVVRGNLSSRSNRPPAEREALGSPPRGGANTQESPDRAISYYSSSKSNSD